MFRAKPNVPFVRLAKIVFKKWRWEKNKKHRVGNECRHTRCPFVVSFLCLWSTVKMVYFFLVLVVCLLLSGRSLHLLPTSKYTHHLSLFVLFWKDRRILFCKIIKYFLFYNFFFNGFTVFCYTKVCSLLFFKSLAFGVCPA